MMFSTAMISAATVRPTLARPALRARTARRVVVVRASTEETPATPATPAPEAAAPSSPLPTPAPKTPSFGEVMAFSGAGPELVNGRLAMLGFVAALGAELSSQESVLAQITQNPSAEPWILYTFVLFIGASLIPLFKGVKNDAFGPFTPNAELINGRASMIGFAALLIIELVKGSALF